MATDLTGLAGSVKLTISMTGQKALDLSTPEDIVKKTATVSYAFGTGAGKADQMWHDQRTLAASGTEDLDLAGALTNSFGGTVTFAKIKAIIILNSSDEQGTPTDASLAVGGAAANQFINWVANSSDIVNIPAGGFLALCCDDANGFVVTAGTGDLLKILNSDAVDAARFDIFIIGESA